MDRVLRYAVLTSSDSGHAGERIDIGGDAVVSTMSNEGHILARRSLLPDDLGSLTRQLQEWADDPAVDLVLTTGGTGLAPRDVMPEATISVIDYQVPGMAEAIRAASLKITKMAMLSRAVVGVANRTLIVNLPGNPKGAVEALEVVLPVLRHAVDITLDTHHGDHPIRSESHSH